MIEELTAFLKESKEFASAALLEVSKQRTKETMSTKDVMMKPEVWATAEDAKRAASKEEMVFMHALKGLGLK